MCANAGSTDAACRCTAWQPSQAQGAAMSVQHHHSAQCNCKPLCEGAIHAQGLPCLALMAPATRPNKAHTSILPVAICMVRCTSCHQLAVVTAAMML